EVGSLIQKQQKNLEQYKGKIKWIQGSAYEQSFQGIQGAFIFNELMDTFPIERLRLIDGKVAQKYVTLDKNNKWVELWDDTTQEVKELLDYKKNKLEYEFPLREDAEEPLNSKALKL